MALRSQQKAVAAQQAGPGEHQQQSDEEGRRKTQRNVADGHERGAGDHPYPARNEPIAKPAAEQRKHRQHGDVKRENLGCATLDAERSADRRDRVL